MGQAEVVFSWTLLLMTSEELIGDVIVNDRLSCSHHEIAELKILRRTIYADLVLREGLDQVTSRGSFPPILRLVLD